MNTLNPLISIFEIPKPEIKSVTILTLSSVGAKKSIASCLVNHWPYLAFEGVEISSKFDSKDFNFSASCFKVKIARIVASAAGGWVS